MTGIFPPKPLRKSFLLRIGVVWTFLRSLAMVGTGMATESTLGLVGPVWSALLVAPIVLVVLFIDLSRRSETVFLANLGISGTQLGVGIVGVCLLLEALLRVIFV